MVHFESVKLVYSRPATAVSFWKPKEGLELPNETEISRQEAEVAPCISALTQIVSSLPYDLAVLLSLLTSIKKHERLELRDKGI